MSPTSVPISAATPHPLRRRFPRLNSKPTELLDAYEVPLRYGRHVPLTCQWTMTVVCDKGTNQCIGAAIYCGDYNRGMYMNLGPRVFKLTQFDFPVEQEDLPREILHYASHKLAHLLGLKFQVSHDTTPGCRITTIV